MRTASYPSDVSDEQWALVEPHLPVYPGGRPRKTDLRCVVDAVLYVLRTGCQWRYLPKDLPPKSTVWRYFDEWRRNGTLDKIHDLLRRRVRAAGKPYCPRTTASVDSQSVDATGGGEGRRRGAGPRQRHERGRPQAARRRGLAGPAAGGAGDGGERGRRQGRRRAVRPAGGRASRSAR
jgi:transposase